MVSPAVAQTGANVLTASPSSLTFFGTPFGASQSQNLGISGSTGLGSPVQYNASSSAAWLTISPPPWTTAFGAAIVTANPSSLPAGTYQGTLTFTPVNLPTGDIGAPINVSVTLSVSAAPQFQATPAIAILSVIAGDASSLGGTTIAIGVTSGPVVPFTTAITYPPAGPSGWLTSYIINGQGGSTHLALNTTGAASLPLGTYSATATISAPGISPLAIPVTLNVTPAPRLTSDLSSIAISVPLGGTASRNILIHSSPPASAQYRVTSSYVQPATPSVNWLGLANVEGYTPMGVTVTASPGSLPAGIYTANLTVTSTSTGFAPLVIPVTMTVTGSQIVTYTPSSLRFEYFGGGAPPFRQGINLGLLPASPVRDAFVSGVTDVPGQTWLTAVLLSDSFGKIVSGTYVGVTVNAAGLPNGTYTGYVNVSVPSGPVSNPQIRVPVTLSVSGVIGGGSANPTVLFSPNQLSFSTTVGGSPADQNLALSTSVSAALPYTLTSNAGWLSAINSSGTTPGSTIIRVTSNGLVPGQHNGSITLNAPGAANNGATVAVSLTVSAPTQQQILLSPSSLSFTGQAGGSIPAPQAVSVTSSGAPVSFQVSSNQNWLIPSPAIGSTPGGFLVQMNAGLMAPGTYSGTLSVLAGSSTANLPVTLQLTNNPALQFSEQTVAFSYQKGQAAPAPRTIAVTSSTSLSIAYTATATTSNGGNWLAVSPANASSPSPITLSLVSNIVSALAPGTYIGTITVNAPGASNTASTISVTLQVSEGALLVGATTPVAFSSQADGAAPPVQTRLITASSGTLSATAVATTANGTGWLTATLNSAVTPATLTIGASPFGLTAGTYGGSVTINGGTNALVIPVTLTVGSVPRLNVNKSELIFGNGANSLSPQTIQLSSSSTNFTYNATANVNNSAVSWLSVTKSSDSTPATLTVAVAPAQLTNGTYYGSILISAPSAGNPSVVIPVTLTVNTDATLRVSPASLSFTQVQGGTTPAKQIIQITSAQPVPFSATTTIRVPTPGAASWLTVTQPTSQTNGSLEVALSAAAASLPVGNHTATISVSSPNLPGAVTVEVTLSVVSTGAPPAITGVANGATYQPGALSPGMLVTLVGRNLGPAQAVPGEIVNGRFTTSVAGVWVLFDGIAAPILYASETQINAIVPYQLAGRASAQLTVQYRNVTSATVATILADAAPGIFTVDGHQAAALNENGTVNSPSNPAQAGSVVVLYLTGEGQTSPRGVDGEIVSNLKKPLAPVRVLVNEVDVPDIYYAGSAPALVSGLMQINLKLPLGLPANAATPVKVYIGTAQSPVGTTIAVRE